MRRRLFLSNKPKGLFLDEHTGATLAFSWRRLSSKYTGFVCKMRDVNTNAEFNVAFDGFGLLSEDSLVTITSAGSSSTVIGEVYVLSAVKNLAGFGSFYRVTTWYDQSGNNNHALQTSTGAQPVIYGTILYRSGKTAVMYCIGAQGFMTFPTLALNADWAALAVGYGTGAFQPLNGAVSPASNFGLTPGNTEYIIQLPGSYQYFFADDKVTVQHLTSVAVIGSSIFGYINGNPKGSRFGDAAANNNTFAEINRYAGFLTPDAYYQEIIFYNSNRLSSLPQMNRDIKDYYAL